MRSSASPAALNHVSGSMPEYWSANSGRNRASRTDGLAGGALPMVPRSAGFMLVVLTPGVPPLRITQVTGRQASAQAGGDD